MKGTVGCGASPVVVKVWVPSLGVILNEYRALKLGQTGGVTPAATTWVSICVEHTTHQHKVPDTR